MEFRLGPAIRKAIAALLLFSLSLSHISWSMSLMTASKCLNGLYASLSSSLMTMLVAAAAAGQKKKTRIMMADLENHG